MNGRDGKEGRGARGLNPRAVETAYRSCDKDAAPPPEERLHLLSRATQVFREQYILKQGLAKEEIQRRWGGPGPWPWPRAPGRGPWPVAGAVQRPRVTLRFCSQRVKLLCDQKKKQLEDLSYCREER